VPLVLLAWLVVTAASPVLLVGALVVDAFRWAFTRTPWMALRMLAFLWVYLCAQVGAVLALAAVWFVPSRRQAWSFALQGVWVTVLFRAMTWIFGIRISVEGTELLEPGPLLVFARHASIVDNLLPYRYVTRPTGIRLRYVLKAELLSDPALDIGGMRLPNHFVRRASGDAGREIRMISRLADGLGPRDGVLIFPEGTRFRADRLERSAAAAARRNPEIAAVAGRLTSVLPPRLGGPLALLDATDADVIFLAHRGLGGFATVGDIWSGAMVGRQVDVRLTRIKRADIPSGRKARAIWLYEVWRELDMWVSLGPVAPR
jgi:1-acyl-sn-glycerol-3-phosphate acyltransferase